MPAYSNGNVPADLLITFASGWDDLGYWEHQWPPHTLALGNALIARAAARRAAAGLPPLPLRLQSGWTAYRPLEWQKTYRAILGNGAATPGASSHGGTFEGRQTMAGDWAWQSVYRDCGGRDAFFADCRAVGLAPGMIMASRGYPDEDWHVIDPDPWAPVPAGFTATPFQEDDMPTMNEFLNTPAYTGGPTISQFFKNVDQGGIAVQVWARTVDRGLDANGNPVRVSALQELADAKSLAMQILGKPVGSVTVDLDEDKLSSTLAASLAATLAPLLERPEAVASLSDPTIDKLVDRLLAEQAARLAKPTA